MKPLLHTKRVTPRNLGGHAWEREEREEGPPMQRNLVPTFLPPFSFLFSTHTLPLSSPSQPQPHPPCTTPLPLSLRRPKSLQFLKSSLILRLQGLGNEKCKRSSPHKLSLIEWLWKLHLHLQAWAWPSLPTKLP